MRRSLITLNRENRYAIAFSSVSRRQSSACLSRFGYDLAQGRLREYRSDLNGGLAYAESYKIAFSHPSNRGNRPYVVNVSRCETLHIIKYKLEYSIKFAAYGALYRNQCFWYQVEIPSLN